MMYNWSDGVGAGWIVLMCVMMLLFAATIAAGLYLAVRESGRERRELEPRGRG